MELSKRLQAAAGLISEGNRLVDVGTDHGYIPIYLVENKKIPSAIAMDVKTGPLSRAEEHIRQAGLNAYITCRLSDGLERLQPGEGDSLLLAGMGGNLMVRILKNRTNVRNSFREIILQPQSAQSLVRKEMEAAGWCTEKEDMVLEDGKFYPMMRWIPLRKAEENDGIFCQNEAEFVYGRLLLREKHPVLKSYLDKQWKVLGTLADRLKAQPEADRSPSAARRLEELEEEIAVLKEALAYYEDKKSDTERSFDVL